MKQSVLLFPAPRFSVLPAAFMFLLFLPLAEMPAAEQPFHRDVRSILPIKPVGMEKDEAWICNGHDVEVMLSSLHSALRGPGFGGQLKFFSTDL